MIEIEELQQTWINTESTDGYRLLYFIQVKSSVQLWRLV